MKAAPLATGRPLWTPCLLFLFALLFTSCLVARAQDADSADRVYKHRKAEVEEALQALKAYATNRLPVLDGFVNANASTIAKLENPHYQLRIEIESQGPNQTLVSVSAKITAWNAEEDPSRSQYVVVPSNGRLEQDMLDRLSVSLEKGNIARSGDRSGGVAPDRSATSASDSAGSSVPPMPAGAPGGNAPALAFAFAGRRAWRTRGESYRACAGIRVSLAREFRRSGRPRKRNRFRSSPAPGH